MSSEASIQNMGTFDVVGVRNDGGIDLVVSCAGPLDSSPDTLWRLGQKVRNYLREVRSDGFRTKYGTGTVQILVSCAHKVSKPARALIKVLEREGAAQKVHVRLVAKVA